MKYYDKILCEFIFIIFIFIYFLFIIIFSSRIANLSYFTVLSPEQVLSSNAVAVTFAQQVLGPLVPIMPIFVAISCLGTVNGLIFTYSRGFFAGARCG
jgi:L-type amino acid transporter 8